MSSSIIQNGLKGIQDGLSRAARDADRISKAFNPGSESEDELVDASIDLKQDVRQVQASRKVVQIGDELNKAVLDILA